MDRTPAVETLMNALDAFTELEEDMEAEVRHVAVAYSVYKTVDGRIEEQTGWSHTADPAWLVAALLRSTAEGIEDNAFSVDVDLDDDDV